MRKIIHQLSIWTITFATAYGIETPAKNILAVKDDSAQQKVEIDNKANKGEKGVTTKSYKSNAAV